MVAASSGGPAIALDPVSLFAMALIGLLLLCCLGACCYFFLFKRLIAFCSDTTCCDACKPRCARCCSSCTWGCWYPACVMLRATVAAVCASCIGRGGRAAPPS